MSDSLILIVHLSHHSSNQIKQVQYHLKYYRRLCFLCARPRFPRPRLPPRPAPRPWSLASTSISNPKLATWTALSLEMELNSTLSISRRDTPFASCAFSLRMFWLRLPDTTAFDYWLYERARKALYFICFLAFLDHRNALGEDVP